MKKHISGSNWLTVFAAVLFAALLFAGCLNPFTEGSRVENVSKKYGSLMFTGDEDYSRALDKETIVRADVTVSGYGMTDITSEDVELQNGKSLSNVLINNIPVGLNRVVSVEAKRMVNLQPSKMDGVVMRKVLDIESGPNTTKVEWASTAAGNVFYSLLKTEGYNTSSVEGAARDTLLSLINTAVTTATHASLVNTAAIATDFKAGSLKAAAQYVITPATVTFDPGTTGSSFTSQVTDPASGALETFTAGTNTITGIAPGTWVFYVKDSGTIVYEQSVTLSAGQVLDLGSLDFKVPDPVFKPSTPYFGGTLVVTLECKKYDDDAPYDADIYYTIDGSTPTTASTPYTSSGISISATTTIKTIAVKSGFANGSSEMTYTHSSIGYGHPSTGAYSPVDMNGASAGYGWTSGTWALGSHSDGDTVTFAVYSKNATKILLEIYNEATGEDAAYDYWMEKGSDNIWRAKINGLPQYTLYAFRAWGSNWPFSSSWTRGNSSAGFVADMDSSAYHRFNPNKVLFDPYARELSHDTENLEMYAAGHNGGMYGTGSTAYQGVPRRTYDTAKWVSKSVFVEDSTAMITKPNIPQQNAIIYESHVRGLTQHPSSSNLQSILSGLSGFEEVVNVPEEYRGTYKGAAYMAPYLKAIGINTIEFLPVHETQNDNNGYMEGTSRKGNFWGYMTFGFFAPDRRYSYDKSYGGPTREFKEMVNAFHAAGIEVYLDVVYNHTGEGGNWSGDVNVTGFTSLGGFDVTEYYHYIPAGLSGDTPGRLECGATGVGNQVNANNAALKTLVLDSLDYWIDDMGVDGFRFDLAATLGRYANQHVPADYWTTVKNFDANHPLIQAIASKGTSKNVKMIAEAWDMWGYPVGSFPAPWGEWNGRYRDALRKYLKGEPYGHDGVSYIDAFNGDYNHFNTHGGPHKSVNFLVAHDGFTLADLVSYSAGGPDQNALLTYPFGPSDGGNDSNESWDSTGTAVDKKDLRRQRIRNFWTFLMFSRGTPMIVYGDELARTQNGNNNPYNLDTVATWNNYNMINTSSPQTVVTGDSGSSYHNNIGTYGNSGNVNGNFIFATFVMNERKNNAALRRSSYGSTTYKKEDGTSDINSFSDRCAWIRIGDDTAGYLIFSNMWEADVDFTVPAAPSGKSWKRIIDTQPYFESANNCWSDSTASTITTKYGVKAWSMVVLKLL
ncbi:chitobiase/beta-hexosaminidase C-terminal domain-containing protein [Brucepastera parasyntrophica]|uniref:alpha-amylase family glycosyl hydrolase n=1 Tax=Brucepastera parasyntrophica TaxID=2880008 RepID=UPI00210ACAC6|nr:alpha-amylase family glycosyl hydrolase [Brucepastera parasyntrophica]ULQ60611.1 chitobiase/beta-hexosaminidase C-terminal domain-containing protein [Brucepastera parasyntrophica]